MERVGYKPCFADLLVMPNIVSRTVASLSHEQLLVADQEARKEKPFVPRRQRAPSKRELALVFEVLFRVKLGISERDACVAAAESRGKDTLKEQDTLRMEYRRAKERVAAILGVLKIDLHQLQADLLLRLYMASL